MKLACRLLNGDGIGFEYAITELTPDYVTDLLRMVDEAKRLKEKDDSFCEIEYMDYGVEYGSSLGGLEDNLPEFGEGRKWIEVPDDFQWPEDSQQSVAASTVAVTKGTLFWRALGSHDYNGPYYETNELSVDELHRLFPQQKAPETETLRYVLFDHDMVDLATTTVYTNKEEAVEDASQLDNVMILPFALETAMSSPGIMEEYGNPTIGEIYLGSQDRRICDCQQPGSFCSGVPGILARVENGQLAEGAKVERCDSCQRYSSDQAAFEKLVELGIASDTQDGSFCPNCQSDQIEGDSVDFDGPRCTQRMRCLDCDANWSNVYVLSNIQA